MLARTFSCAVVGLDGVIVEVEVDYTNGLPGMTIVGLPDAAVQESRERVQTAVKNAGLHFPRHRIVVNLAPASVRKEGPSYDLPIALGVILLAEYLPHETVEGTLVVGELSLDGVVRHTRGVLSMAAAARANGFKRMFVPEADAAEAALIPDLEIIPVRTLADLYEHLSGQRAIEPYQRTDEEPVPLFVPTDFAEVHGQEHVKRALEVAAAGGHNVLMVGSPGAGKDAAGARHAGHPAGDEPRGVAGCDAHLLGGRPAPAGDRPHPHAAVPRAASHHQPCRAGGRGQHPAPGEISLAHRGVLFLDEFPEFGARVLEVMRQPMEDKVVTISRAKGSLTFSANFQLIAAMNPCPCGWYGDSQKPCTCGPGMVTKYQKRISGPLLDRIDIHIEVPRVDYDKLSGDRLGERSEIIRARVQAARDMQRERFTPSLNCILQFGGGMGRGCLQCGHAPGGGPPVLQAAGRGTAADARGDEPAEPVGAGLSSHPETGAHHRGPGRLRGDRVGASGGGVAVPAEDDVELII